MDVLARKIVLADDNSVVVETWRSVRDAKTDDLHVPLSDLGFPPSRISIIYQNDPLQQKTNQRRLGPIEEQQLRGTIAGLNWTARQGRPDAAAASSMIASSFPEPTVADARTANVAVQRTKELDAVLVLWAIPEPDLRRLVVSDAVFDTSGQQKSQHGYLIGYTEPKLAQGETASVSLVVWKSRRLRRKAGSSLLCEAQAGHVASGVMLLAANLDQATGHVYGAPLAPIISGPPTVLTRQTRLSVDPHCQMVVDAKALYDMLISEQLSQDDPRAALEASMIKEDMLVLAGIPRWVPHDKNPADALTKHEGAHSLPLLQLLRTGHFEIRAEAEELEDRKEVKDELGHVPRPRISQKVGRQASV